MKYIFDLCRSISAFSWFMMGLQFYYLYQVFVTDDTGGLSFSVDALGLVILSMISTLVFFQSLSILTSGRRFLIVASNFIGLTLYGLLAAYHFGAHDLFQWSVFIDNISSAFSKEAFDVIINSLDTGALLYIPPIMVIFAWREWKSQSMSRKFHQTSSRRAKLIWPFVYVLFVILPFESLDPILNFTKSITQYYFHPVSSQISLPDDTYPLIKIDSSVDTTKKAPKYIFLILAESLNASALDQTNPEGKEVTPFLNALRSKSVFIETFYGNSVQTAKGHFATLFSIIPSMSGKTFTKYKTLRAHSLATELAEVGYDTTLFTAFEDENFDNEGPFLKARGFDAYITVPKGDSPSSWGVFDPTFFEAFASYLDNTLSKRSKPQFVTLVTIANHFPFNKVPEAQRELYPNPESFQQNYANSVHLTDKGIQLFYKALKDRGLLKDSLIVVTADHAFPMGEHGNYHLEVGYHEESFRIPFFMTWEGVLEPQVLTSAHSQLDIAPTIIDVAGLQIGENTFMGHSIFKKTNSVQHLIQPYGKQFCVVRFPLKYRFNAKSGKEYIYHLSNDPMEENNILKDLSKETLTQFREDYKTILLTQACISRNQVLPPPKR